MSENQRVSVQLAFYAFLYVLGWTTGHAPEDGFLLRWGFVLLCSAVVYFAVRLICWFIDMATRPNT